MSIAVPAQHPSGLLRFALLADAAASGVLGLGLALFAGPIAQLLGLSEALPRYAGILLVVWGAAVLWLGTRPRPPARAVWAVIALNALWAVDSVLLLLSGWIAPTTLGLVFILFQAAAVTVFAELQYVGLRRTAARHTAPAGPIDGAPAA
ncbi:MAG: hypothetical protein ACK4QW_09865 [Alphaproteobacteria bacterium]